MSRIVVLDGYAENPGDLSWEAVAGQGTFTVYDRTAPEEVAARIGDAEIVLTNKTPLTAEVFQSCPSIRYVGVLATGYNIVDVTAATACGVTVTNIPSYGTAAVAQFTFALLLELCHQAGRHSDTVHGGRWSASPDFCYWDFPQVLLEGQTLGIVGYGRIGQAVARLALAFGMQVLAYSPQHAACPGSNLRPAGLEEIFAQSDVISLHCPLTPETAGLINTRSIAQMKDGVFLVNTARGGLIVEEDLRAGLLSGKVGGAALDVLAEEPPRQGSPLFNAPNCIITPHIAWAAKAARSRLMEIAAENLTAWRQGHPQNVVSGPR